MCTCPDADVDECIVGGCHVGFYKNISKGKKGSQG